MKRYAFHPVLLLRSPAYAFSHVKETSLQGHLDTLYFRNALFIAAPQFYHEVKKEDFQVKALKPKAIRALGNYLNRLHYRNTPFGMFSGFCSLSWQGNDESCNPVILKDKQLHLLPEWRDGINEPLAPKEFDDKLLLFSNPSIYRAGDELRFLKYEYVDREGGFQFHISTIADHELLNFILKYCISPVAWGALKEEALETQGIDERQLWMFVQHLIVEKLLLREMEEQLLHIKEVKRLVLPGDSLRNQDITGYTRNSYANLHYVAAEGKVARQYQSHIIDGLIALQAMCMDVVPDGLRKFVAAFERKFEGRSMPMMVVLDPELGIGYRQLEHTYYQSPLLEGLDFPGQKASFKQVQWTDIHSLLMNKMQLAPQLREKGIFLNEQDLHGFATPAKPLPPGLSVLFRQMNDEVFLESAGGATATALFGRFSIFDTDIAGALRDIACNEVCHNPSVVFAEINCLQHLHTANVEHRVKAYPYEIPLVTFPSSSAEDLIPLSDLWISVKEGRIVLWSERLRKEVIPRLSSAFNHSRSHMHVYRFLCDLQYQGLQTNFTLDLSHYFPDLDFYPRVTYKGAVLSLACWTVRLSQDTLKSIEDEAGKITAIRTYLLAQSVPRYFASYTGDQQLIYDMESDSSILAFCFILQSGQALKIKEFPFPYDSNPVQDMEGKKYLPQYLTALLHPQEVYLSDISEHISSASLFTNPRQAGDWVYYKVYCHPGNSIMLLKEVMSIVQEKLMAERLIDCYFYVIYFDPDYHLRLRFRCTTPGSKTAVIPALENALQFFRNQGSIAAIHTAEYQRELERYGAGNIELVEQIFSADTGWIMWLFGRQEMGRGFIMESVISVEAVLGAFCFSLKEKVEHCREIFEALFSEFSGNRALQVSLANKYRLLKSGLAMQLAEICSGITENSHYQRLYSLLRELAIQNKSAGQLWLRKLAADLVHMHLNRLFIEQPREQEMVVYFLLYNHYNSMYHRHAG